MAESLRLSELDVELVCAIYMAGLLRTDQIVLLRQLSGPEAGPTVARSAPRCASHSVVCSSLCGAADSAAHRTACLSRTTGRVQALSLHAGQSRRTAGGAAAGRGSAHSRMEAQAGGTQPALHGAHFGGRRLPLALQQACLDNHVDAGRVDRRGDLAQESRPRWR